MFNRLAHRLVPGFVRSLAERLSFLRYPLASVIDERVAQLHESEYLLNVMTTGAAGGLLANLWRSPGASNTILGCGLKYAREALTDAIDHEPDSFASSQAALYMAATAYEKGFGIAVRRGEAARPVIGIGMCAAVSTDRARKGSDRVFVAVRTPTDFFLVAAEFDKPGDSDAARARRRTQEGILCDLLVLNVLLWAAGIEQLPLSTSYGITSEQIVRGPRLRLQLAPKCVTPNPEVLFNQVFWPDGSTTALDELDLDKVVLYPGSFNPLTPGHAGIADVIGGMTNKRVVCQISQRHPVKAGAGVPEEDLRQRLLQFAYRRPILLLRKEGLYVDKAQLFPGVPLLLGVDAARAVLNPEFYGGIEERRKMLDRLVELRSCFLVMGRLNSVTGEFETRDDLDMPQRYAHLFHGVSARWDDSSTLVREQQKRGWHISSTDVRSQVAGG
jgi:hypothetical protein